ncbi:hypothetical protein EIP91_000929 [Steccherinum ochraceum]|uniref:Uncharacterized protein n=1 Tax=Steccherinum ochraceum TaxID=92696 RepID=A0A4R0RIY2_9APHY|nr:hypothetical protein EIP91_000929 [Steccherinum ochraceum]
MSSRPRSRSQSFTATLSQLTKRRTTTPVPPTPPPPPPSSRSSTTTTTSKRLHINFPHIFRMHPFQPHAHSKDFVFGAESVPDLGLKDTGDDDEVVLDLDAFAWPTSAVTAEEKRGLVATDATHGLSSHIGHKILDDIDLDALSSESSSSSSGSEHDSESDCSEVTVIHSAPLSTSSSTAPLNAGSISATPSQDGAVGLSPPWWHYSLRRKLFTPEELAVSEEHVSSQSGQTLLESVGRWPDQEGDEFMF